MEEREAPYILEKHPSAESSNWLQAPASSEGISIKHVKAACCCLQNDPIFRVILSVQYQGRD
jgi:hypothetical protein